jgi:chemotaxis protein CheD
MNQEKNLQITLKTGEFYFGGNSTAINTLLGSCVAITMWHPLKQIGGMCHFLLPVRGKNEQLSYGHFADDALQLFMKNIKLTYTRPEDYEVKLFGGGNMLFHLQDPKTSKQIGEINVSAGIDILTSNGFNIKQSDTGGRNYRHVSLQLDNGDVWVRKEQASIGRGNL